MGVQVGDSVIHLYCGADSTEQQEVHVCEKLLAFLKGPNYSKSALHVRDQEPTLFAHFQLIWKIRDNQMVPDLPSYVFFSSAVTNRVVLIHDARLAGYIPFRRCRFVAAASSPPFRRLPFHHQDTSSPAVSS